MTLFVDFDGILMNASRIVTIDKADDDHYLARMSNGDSVPLTRPQRDMVITAVSRATNPAIGYFQGSTQ